MVRRLTMRLSHPLAEIEEILERAAGFGRLEDDVHRLLAGALDRPEAVADRACASTGTKRYSEAFTSGPAP
jgi:hypothetical protein